MANTEETNVRKDGGKSGEAREALRKAAENRPRTKDGRFASSPSPAAAPEAPETKGFAVPKKWRCSSVCSNCQLCPVALQMQEVLAKYPNGDAPESEINHIRQICGNCDKPMCKTNPLKPREQAHTISQDIDAIDPSAKPAPEPPKHDGVFHHALHAVHNRLADHPLLKLLPFPFPSLESCDETAKTYIMFLLERLLAETNAAEKYRTRCRHLLYGFAAVGLLAFNLVVAYLAHRYWK